jgi:hypothetical protein
MIGVLVGGNVGSSVGGGRVMMMNVAVGKMNGVEVGNWNGVGDGKKKRVGVEICPGVGPMGMKAVAGPNGVIDALAVSDSVVIGVNVAAPGVPGAKVGPVGVRCGAKASSTNPMQ